MHSHKLNSDNVTRCEQTIFHLLLATVENMKWYTKRKMIQTTIANHGRGRKLFITGYIISSQVMEKGALNAENFAPFGSIM